MLIDRFLGRERFKTPGARIGIGGFDLFARVNEQVTLTANAPTAYVEDGSPLNDHIIRDAEQLVIEGVVGDIYRGPETNILQAIPTVNFLGAIAAYLPRTTSFQANVIDGLRNTTAAAAARLNDILGTGNQINSIMGNLDTSSKPLAEQFIDAMENIYYSNQLVSIDMPYRRYENMVLTNVVVRRDNTTNAALSFTINAQRFRIAETSFALVQRVDKNPSPAVGGQTESVKDVGTQAGVKRERSMLARYTPFGEGGQ